ncbi:alpha/beta hydrolase [Liquorilactobacillus sicerae]|uniref:alpha/beta hydrolase n=1 Tax=Liquorilactobacillus sicerae TaxID=1416943 RepID=UPI00248013B2|nr:alpha/beta hydrolase [Liquorilactobacillus sicerae]
MKKYYGLWVVLVILGVTMVGWTKGSQSNNRTQTPTFFLHGYGSSYRAELFFVRKAKQAGVTDSVVRANVLPTGKVLLQHSATWRRNSRNPIVEVDFVDNRDRNYHQDADWLADALHRLQRKYHFHKYNVVAHSMGNLDLMYYLLGDKRLSGLKLKHQVDIAGPFDGSNIDGYSFLNNRLQKNGLPTRLSFFYHYFLTHRDRYSFDQTRVMNIYGNLNNGSNSDGRVSTVSARSLKYLLQHRAKSYQQIKISGASAQHSRLHHNLKVSRLINQFLWKAS